MNEMSKKREKKGWWAVVDAWVVHVTGYSCAPTNPETWWCPAVGYSLHENHQLFEREEDAVRKAVAVAEREVEKWTETLKKLKARLPNQQQGNHD